MGGPRGRPQLRFFGSRLGTLRVLPAQNGGPIKVTPGTLVRAPWGMAGDPPYKNRVTTTRGAVGPLGSLGRWAVGLIGPLGRWAHWSLVALACTGAHWEGPPKLVNELMSLLSTKHKPHNGTYRTYSKVSFVVFPPTARSCVSSWHLWPWYRRFQRPPCSGDPSCAWPCGKRPC